MTEVFTIILSSGLQYPYRIVHSKRAKYIRIKLTQQGELSVTLPAFAKSKLAHDFIKTKSLWIEKNLQKITPHQPAKLPQNMNLRLLDEYWSVQYKELDQSIYTNLKLVEINDSTIQLQGNYDQVKSPESVSKTLNHWCKKKAAQVFNQMLQEEAELHGFHFQRLSIRAQKTRWGSCSQQKNINLNCKLLFMPEAVVKYVMVHELCHTIEMNHSSRFWALVEECDPNYKDHKKQLKKLGREITI